jgi:hypothetical protein
MDAGKTAQEYRLSRRVAIARERAESGLNV